LGRVRGFYLIFDVEAARVIHREMVNGGVIPFQQFQQARDNGWRK
jgi:hypothetical protein